MWEPREGVRFGGCILRRVTPTPPPLVRPGLLVVHLGGLFGQILGMEVGEVMEGDGTTRDCTLSVLFHSALSMCVAGERG